MFLVLRGGVFIGNNVFIGVHSTILKGVHIGNNVIIGANSLVNKNIPDNMVAAGNPCRVIMTLEEYHEKRKAAQVGEARELVYQYRECYRKEPDEKALREFFWLFEDGKRELPLVWKEVMLLMKNEDMSYRCLKENVKQFDNMDDFLTKI